MTAKFPKGRKICIPNGLKYSKWSNICQPFPFQGPPKYTQVEIFGMKICHLAILEQRSVVLA
jgi:hypothetical protein